MDIYRSFDDLAKDKKENRDYQRQFENRGSWIVILAPHGGGIEPGTSEVALAIAGNSLSYYVFEGIQSHGNEDLHITSTRFDDPDCLSIVEASPFALSIHGCVGTEPKVFVGGLNEKLMQKTIVSLRASGFNALIDETDHSGRYRGNLCNKCNSGSGVQLEISEGLRRSLFQGLKRRGRIFTRLDFDRLVTAISEAIIDYKQETFD